MISVKDVANFFIDIVNKNDDDQITNLKLNKLLYFAQGCHLSRTGEPLFDNKIEAWPLGPVVPEIYQKYKVCGKAPIQTIDDDYSDGVFSDMEMDTLLDVMREYGQYTGPTLVSITHRAGTPWSDIDSQGLTIIPNELMKTYFEKHPIPTTTDLINRIPTVTELPRDWYDPTEDEEWEAYL